MMKLLCSMCEQEVESLPYTLIDDIPEHVNADGTPHTQKICQECKEAVGIFSENGDHIIDKSTDLQKHPLRIAKK